MKEMIKRLEEIMLETGIKQVDLAKIACVSTQAVNNWFKREKISTESAKKICFHTGYSLRWLLDGVGNKKEMEYMSQNVTIDYKDNKTAISLDNKKSYIIKPLEVTERNSDEVANIFKQNIISIEMALEYAVSMFGTPLPKALQQTSALTDSMHGTIPTNANIIVDSNINKFYGNGIYLFLYNDIYHMNRLQLVGDKVVIISDNEKYDKWEININELHKFKIFGQVTGYQTLNYTSLR